MFPLSWRDLIFPNFPGLDILDLRLTSQILGDGKESFLGMRSLLAASKISFDQA